MEPSGWRRGGLHSGREGDRSLQRGEGTHSGFRRGRAGGTSVRPQCVPCLQRVSCLQRVPCLPRWLVRRGRLSAAVRCVALRGARAPGGGTPAIEAVGEERRGHGEDVGDRVVGEVELIVGVGLGEGNGSAPGDAALAVVLVPALRDRDLALVAADRQAVERQAISAVAVEILQPTAQAVGLPVSRATELRLEAPRHGGDDRSDVVGDPVRAVAVVELDGGGGAERERNVRAAEDAAQAVALVPAAVQRGEIFVAPGGQREGALPDPVARVVGEAGRRTGRVPVARATGLRLQRAGDDDRGRRPFGLACGALAMRGDVELRIGKDALGEDGAPADNAGGQEGGGEPGTSQ